MTELKAPADAAIDDAPASLLCGDSYSQDKRFSGKLGLLRIIKRNLSALEIQDHFSREKQLFGVW